MNKRTKVVLGIVLGVLVLAFGVTFVLARAGIVHIGILADSTYDANLDVIIQDSAGNPIGRAVDVEIYRGTFSTRILATPNSSKPDKIGRDQMIASFTGLIPNNSYNIRLSSEYCQNMETSSSTDANGTTTSFVILYSCTSVNPNPQNNVFSIKGRFVDSASGKYLPGGTATITPSNGTSVSSDANGLFYINNITYSQDAKVAQEQFDKMCIGFDVAGYDIYYSEIPPPGDCRGNTDDLSRYLNTVNISPGGTYNIGQIKMQKREQPVADIFSISGKVVSGSTPIRGAVVSINHSSFKSTHAITSASDGTFKISNIPFLSSDSSAYTIVAQAGGYGDYKQSLQKSAVASVTKGKDHPITINLAPKPGAFTIVGTVKDSSGLVAGAKITTKYIPTGAAGNATSASSNIITSNQPGEYNYQASMANLPVSDTVGKQIEVTITPPTTHKLAAGATKTITIASGVNYARADFELKKIVQTTLVTGVVRDQMLTLKSGISVSAKTTDFDITTTTQDGKFTGSDCFKLGAYCLFEVPKEKSVQFTFSNLPSGYMIEGGNTQTLDLSSAGASFKKDFTLIPDPKQVGGSSFAIYGKITEKNTLNYIGGVKIIADWGTGPAYVESVNDKILNINTYFHITAPGGIPLPDSDAIKLSSRLSLPTNQEYNYVFPITIENWGNSHSILLRYVLPSGYKFVTQPPESITFTAGMRSYPVSFDLEKEAQAIQNIQIGGRVLDKANAGKAEADRVALDGVTVKVISINTPKNGQLAAVTDSSQTITTVPGTDKKISFLTSTIPKSVDNKYLITFDKNGYKRRTLALNGMAPNSSNYIIIPQDIVLTKMTWLEKFGSTVQRYIIDPISNAVDDAIKLIKGGSSTSEYTNVVDTFNKAEKITAPTTTTPTTPTTPPTATTCTPLASQTQTVSCPSGQKGSILQARISTCPSPTANPIWGEWKQTASSCTSCGWLDKLLGRCK